jgi:hypothetical protein
MEKLIVGVSIPNLFLDAILIYYLGVGHENRKIPEHNEKFLQVSCSESHCCALDEKAYPVCWGETKTAEIYPPTLTKKEYLDSKANFGWYVKDEEDEEDEYNEEEDENKPINESDNEVSFIQFRQIAVGEGLSCGITLLGAHLRCWGIASQFRKMKLSPITQGPYRQVSVGGFGVCAITGSEEEMNQGSSVKNNQDEREEEEEDTLLKVSSLPAEIPSDSLQCWGIVNMFLNKEKFEAWDQISIGNTVACGVSMDSELECSGMGITANYPEHVSVIVA